MQRYNRVFTHVLRLKRVHAALCLGSRPHRGGQDEFGPSMHLFLLQGRRFLECMMQYVVHTGIESVWQRWKALVPQMTRRGEEGEEEGKGWLQSLQGLRQLHDHVLDTILDRCLLQPGQGHVMRQIERTLDVLLALGRYLSSPNPSREDSRQVGALHEDFTLRIRRLIGMLRQLSMEGSGGDMTGGPIGKEGKNAVIQEWDRQVKTEEAQGPGSHLESLAFSLDVNGWYGRGGGGGRG